MKHQSYYQSYKALQAFEIKELRRCLEAHGGSYNWNDEAHENETKPIICVGLDYYVGDVDVNRAYIDDKGAIKIDADEHDGWADMTFDADEVQFGNIGYIMDYMEDILTETEKQLICQAASDLESGNYLLRKRTDEQLTMIQEVSKALNTPEQERDSRQVLICEEYRLCTDYEYAKSKGKAT